MPAATARDIADRLAKLSRSLEKHGEDPEVVAHFLMRVLFTLFAEDIQLIPKDSFTNALKGIEDEPELFAPLAEGLWTTMNHGGVAAFLKAKVPRFNGGLFAECHAIDLDHEQLQLLIRAAERDCTDVEPAIFGTLLERALNPRERHKLGATISTPGTPPAPTSSGWSSPPSSSPCASAGATPRPPPSPSTGRANQKKPAPP